MSNGTAATASSHYGYGGTTLVFISAHENERAMKKKREREKQNID